MIIKQNLNKLKMNLDKQGIIILDNVNMLRLIIQYLEKNNFIEKYEISEDKRYLFVSLNQHNIKTIIGYTIFHKYSNKSLNKKILSTLTKNSGVFLLSTNQKIIVMNHKEVIKQGIGGVIIAYVE